MAYVCPESHFQRRRCPRGGEEERGKMAGLVGFVLLMGILDCAGRGGTHRVLTCKPEGRWFGRGRGEHGLQRSMGVVVLDQDLNGPGRTEDLGGK